MEIRLIQFLKGLGDAFVSLFFPPCCPVCGHPLPKGERALCLPCNMGFPRTNYHLEKDNPVEKLFWGKVHVERATSYFFYRRGSDYREILQRIKYRGEEELGEVMGAHLAAELARSDFFDGIDLLVPVPLHAKKLAQRGYNQSVCIARGIASVTGIPVDVRSVVRERHTETQTQKSPFERWSNVDSVFVHRSPKLHKGKHVLLVDDVLTTGATTVACASAFLGVEDVRISVLTLAVAQQ